MKRAEYYEMVKRCGMQELKNNAIEDMTIGHYVESETEIAELEELSKNHDESIEVTAEYYPWGGVKYKVIPNINIIEY